MADEPERRVVGAMLAELEEQARMPFLALGIPDSMGTVRIEGEVDLYLLAQAVMREVKSCE